MGTVHRIVALVLAAALAAPVVVLALPGRLVVVALVGLTALAAGVLYRRRSADDTGGSVWEHVPDWQYDGRHVESGGLTRDEQEQALRDIDEQAKEIDPDH
jgi:hypothetical protein